ncbi:MAG: hypothetical protein ACREQF_04555 [Candidatus Binataceae bacterium]
MASRQEYLESKTSSRLRGDARADFISTRQKFFALVLALAAIALGASGCWYAAIQYAPVALSAAAQLGAGAVHLTAGLVGATHGSFASEDTRPGENELDRQERCRQLAQISPGVIELHQRADGVAEYRGLEIASISEEIQWKSILEMDTDGNGWRPAANYLQMNFKPPLTEILSKDEMNFLAYAPAESKSPEERYRLAALINNFGGALGSFNSYGRVYAYSVVHSLPCYPSPE